MFPTLTMCMQLRACQHITSWVIWTCLLLNTILCASIKSSNYYSSRLHTTSNLQHRLLNALKYTLNNIRLCYKTHILENWMTTRRDIYSKKELIVKYIFREKKKRKTCIHQFIKLSTILCTNKWSFWKVCHTLTLCSLATDLCIFYILFDFFIEGT